MTSATIAARLPSPVELARLSISIAALDSVLSPEWQYRYFSFDPIWGEKQRLASMRSGSGDSYQIVFSELGTVVRCFWHESALSPWGREDNSLAPGLLDGFPPELQFVINEPAFRTEGMPSTDLTFCSWRLAGQEHWETGTNSDDGGASELLEVVLDGTERAYLRHAREYFEVNAPRDAVAAFFRHEPVGAEHVRALNPAADPIDTLAEVRMTGYPTR
jgi:hypothetical protein